MIVDKLKYFKIAKELNAKYHEFLIENQLHFRGNINSFSVVSVNQNTPECGKSALKSISQAENYLTVFKNNGIKIPGRKTEEKNLQAFIINHALNNKGVLPFGDFSFITSEIAIQLDENKRIVNDILAIDSKNNLAIIELKSLRSNKVKQQTIDFENKVVIPQSSFIKELVFEMTGKNWNGKTRKIAVWKAPNSVNNLKLNDKNDVELYNYTFEGQVSEKSVIMNSVCFSKE